MAEKVERRELLKRLWLLVGAGTALSGAGAMASRHFRSVHVKGVTTLQDEGATNQDCTNDVCENAPCTNDPCTNGYCTNAPCTNDRCTNGSCTNDPCTNPSCS